MNNELESLILLRPLHCSMARRGGGMIPRGSIAVPTWGRWVIIPETHMVLEGVVLISVNHQVFNVGLRDIKVPRSCFLQFLLTGSLIPEGLQDNKDYIDIYRPS